jgi:predicted TIM-barrel fold metal-dependent hydrolase
MSDIGRLALEDYHPRTELVRPETMVETPCCAVIDAHNHLGADFGGGWDSRPVEELLAVLDEAHVSAYVDLDGGWGEDILDARLRKFKAAAPERFICFGSPEWKRWPEKGTGFGAWTARNFRRQVERGAQGLKIWKDFGLHVRDDKGMRVGVDDERLAPLWDMAGELNVPVLVHVADPVAFFQPLDATNERWEELHAHPDWHFPPDRFPPFGTIIEAFARLVRRHPATTFIGAHVACYAENLAWVDALMAECPNLLIDFSQRIAEIGRQPQAARRLLTRYQDRVLFGTDSGPRLDMYRTYYRFLETNDEYFSYEPSGRFTQGRWHVSGLGLERTVLEKIYHRNAAALFGIGPR